MDKKWIIIGGLILVIFLTNINGIKTSVGCTESDEGDIWIKGTCSDSSSYDDFCRIDGGKELIELTCSEKGCISERVDCSSYGTFCEDGRCIRE